MSCKITYIYYTLLLCTMHYTLRVLSLERKITSFMQKNFQFQMISYFKNKIKLHIERQNGYLPYILMLSFNFILYMCCIIYDMDCVTVGNALFYLFNKDICTFFITTWCSLVEYHFCYMYSLAQNHK
jgi:hypothetical protein